ncbi:hypothetical protein AVEN_36682-1 [Araneus ventricosus]|uniref:Uncharacterized protein n=1 Tax=Araneus ventricosus TaxID=182803 RepID=A0A4Y2MT40_ARAVE|nr:hypothetical protein AVEN_36682-1 [Araneus ventricosus]
MSKTLATKSGRSCGFCPGKVVLDLVPLRNAGKTQKQVGLSKVSNYRHGILKVLLHLSWISNETRWQNECNTWSNASFSTQSIYRAESLTSHITPPDISDVIENLASASVSSEKACLDFEYIITPNTQEVNAVSLHEPCGYCYVVIGPDGKSVKPPTVYRGIDAAKLFVPSMLKEEEEISSILKKISSLSITTDEERSYNQLSTVIFVEWIKIYEYIKILQNYSIGALQSCTRLRDTPFSRRTRGAFCPAAHSRRRLTGGAFCPAAHSRRQRTRAALCPAQSLTVPRRESSVSKKGATTYV